MKNFNNILISPATPVIDAIKALDSTALQILLVVDENKRLLGTVTDGDIRRGILRGLDLKEFISKTMNETPITISTVTDRDVALSLMRSRSIQCIPVIDELRRVVGLETESHLFFPSVEDTCVVLMAGGLGMRLRPLTETTPKPLLKVNGKPMLEHIIERFVEQGFRRFYLSVNYKSEMIKKYFGDGAAWGAAISYIDEDQQLGTGGALSLLPRKNISKNIIVMNGDLLTTLNFRQLLNFHEDSGGCSTMCVRDYSIKVPYGVVRAEGEEFVDIVEKPAHSYFVNTGIYVIESDELIHMPKNVFFNLPDLFGLLKSKGKRVTVFPIREEWCDIGSFHDYEQAQTEAKEQG